MQLSECALKWSDKHILVRILHAQANYMNALSFQRYLAITPYLNKHYVNSLAQVARFLC